MMWNVLIQKGVLKQLKHIYNPDKKYLLEALDSMKTDPFTGDVKMLLGARKGSYRRRVGSWRIFFVVDTEVKIVSVADVKRRSSKTYS